MREIKFRGKDPVIKKWAYGYYVKSYGKAFIVLGFNKSNTEFYFNEVVSETVGQFTGLQDKNGKDIYEGDIVKWDNENYLIKYGKKVACFLAGHCWICNCNFVNIEIIGNIHDNPELLEAK